MYTQPRPLHNKEYLHFPGGSYVVESEIWSLSSGLYWCISEEEDAADQYALQDNRIVARDDMFQPRRYTVLMPPFYI